MASNDFRYYADDLVVLTWDRAFIYEPRGDSDVMDVLDVANAQLLEMRYYDQLLDAELPNMYNLVQKMQRARPLFGHVGSPIWRGGFTRWSPRSPNCAKKSTTRCR